MSAEFCGRLTESPGAVGANGTQLDVLGKVRLPVTLGPFTTEEEFTVIGMLTVDCLVGAQFLKRNAAVINCAESTLHIRVGQQHTVPLATGSCTDCKPAETVSSGISAVVAPADIEIPGRTVCLISGQLHGEPISQGDVLIEQSQGTIPANLCIGRTLSSMTNGGE